MNGIFIWINHFETNFEVYIALIENAKSGVYENIWKMDDNIMHKNVMFIDCIIVMDILRYL